MPPKKEKDLIEEEIIKTYKMIEGDYTVQVRILEANDLVPTIGGFSIFKSKGSSCDGMIQVTCQGKRKITKVKKGQISPVFNQQFTFKLDNMKKQQLKDAVITITAYDKKLIALKNPIIGQYELDLSSVYFSVDHEFFHTWLTLSDPTDEREGIMGYVLVNISVLGPNDEPVIHTVSTDKKADAPGEKSLVPHKIKQFPHSVNVRLFKGEHMVPLDALSAKIDAYVQVKYAGSRIRSDVKTSRNPEWYQELNLGVMLPNQSRFVNFEVFDRDLLRPDEMVGCFRVPFRDIYLHEDLLPQWTNIYGPPMFGKGSHADLMTLYGDSYGSHYRGRIFYQMASYDERDSRTFKKHLNYKFPNNPRPQCEQKSYVLRVDLIEGHEFPQRENVYIHVMMGPYLLCSQPCKMLDGTIFFYEQLADKKVLFPKDIDQVPDIIFYFADEHIQDRRHTFYRIKAKDVLDQPRIPKVIKMQEDRSLGLCTDDEFPGFLYANVQLMSVNPGQRKPFQPNDAEKVDYQLRVNLFLGRNLPPHDATGTSDSYVKVRCGGKMEQSKTCKQTLNPGWYETLVMDVKLYPLDQPCVVPGGMFVMLFDADNDDGSKKDDLIGRIWITLEPNLITFQKDASQPEVDMFYRKPKWYNIIYDATDEVQGQVLLSYSLIKKADIDHVPIEPLYPACQKTKLHFFCIGLRNIDDMVDGIEPQNCSVSFDVSGADQEAVYTDPQKVKVSGININRLIGLDLDVPNNQNFCPVMDVFTWEESPGQDKKLLGTTSIQLSQILSSYYKRRKLPVGAIMEEESEDEEQELIDHFEKERLGQREKTKTELKVVDEVDSHLNEDDLDQIDLAVPWELPIKRKLMEEVEFRSKVQELKEEKLKVAAQIEEEELQADQELPEPDSEKPVYQQTIYQTRPVDGLPVFYPQQWDQYKQLTSNSPTRAQQPNNTQPTHIPSQWDGLKQMQPKKVQFDAKGDIVKDDPRQSEEKIDISGRFEDEEQSLISNNRRNEMDFNGPQFQNAEAVRQKQKQNSQQINDEQAQRQKGSKESVMQFDSLSQVRQQQDPSSRQQLPSQQSQQYQKYNQPSIKDLQDTPKYDQSKQELSVGSGSPGGKQQKYSGQSKPDGYSNPRISQPPPPPMYGEQNRTPSLQQVYSEQNKVQGRQSYNTLQQPYNDDINQEVMEEEDQHVVVQQRSNGLQADQRSVSSSKKQQEHIFSSNKPSEASRESQRRPSLNGSLYERQANKGNQDKQPSEKVVYENDKRPSQVQKDYRAKGTVKSLKNDIDAELIVDPERHYKNQLKEPLLLLPSDKDLDGSMHGAIRGLSQKSLTSFKAKSVKQEKSVKMSMDNVSVGGRSIQNARVGSQPLLPYSKQLLQEQHDADVGSKGATKLPPSGMNSFNLITNLPKKTIVNTLQVGSQVSFSQASKVSSHALSLSSVGRDNMNVKPSGKERPIKKKKKNFGDRLKGNLGMFGFNFKKQRKGNNTDVETYEEFDTDPNEDLSIIPEWLRDRPFFTDDLEDYIVPSRKFMKFDLKRGKARSSKSMFKTEKQAEPDEVCTLKCIFLEEKPGCDIEAKRELYQKLMKPKQYVCRLYALEGVNITTESEDPPDLFLKLKMCGQEYDVEKQTFCVGTINPQFYLGYEIACEMPGSSYLRIEVWQKKNSFEKAMVGYTEVDLEDRYFSIEWHRYPLKPIEFRNLKNEFGTSVGRLQMWIDLVERGLTKANPQVKIEAPPRYEFELRTIVWETKNCIFKDQLAKCNDLFGRGGPANQEFQETDVHWRCRAKGSFNWRMKYATKFPMMAEEYGSDQFKLQLWDKDIIGANELIGETEMPLNTHKMIDKAVKRKKGVKMLQRIREKGGQITDRFWLDVFHPDAVDDEGKKIPQGQVCVSIELLPTEESTKNANGLGRDAPNNFPPLAEPTGRLSFDLGNPLQFIKDIMGPDLYQKLCRTLGGCLCLALFIGFGWIFFIQVLSGLILKA